MPDTEVLQQLEFCEISFDKFFELSLQKRLQILQERFLGMDEEFLKLMNNLIGEYSDTEAAAKQEISEMLSPENEKMRLAKEFWKIRAEAREKGEDVDVEKLIEFEGRLRGVSAEQGGFFLEQLLGRITKQFN